LLAGPPLIGMLIYSAVVTLYPPTRFAGGLTGILLCRVVLHGILTALLIRHQHQ